MEVIQMGNTKLKKLLSKLMGSPFFHMLSARQKRAILMDIKKSYPVILEDEGFEIGYEASWTEVIKCKHTG
jgi:hypothetical protein